MTKWNSANLFRLLTQLLFTESGHGLPPSVAIKKPKLSALVRVENIICYVQMSLELARDNMKYKGNGTRYF